MVVINHMASYGFQALFFWTDRYLPVTVPNFDQRGSLTYYFLLLIHQLAEYAIPAFLFVSGYFIAFTARGSKGGVTADFVSSRIKKLLGPFLFWSVVVIILLRRFPPDFQQIMTMYYFIPLIIQFYLLSPVIVPLARDRWKLLLVLAAILQLGIESLRLLSTLGVALPGLHLMIGLTPIWFFPGKLLYFSIGVVAGFHYKEMGAWLSSVKWILLGVTVGLLALSIVEYETLTQLSSREFVVSEFSGMSRTLYAISFVLTYLAFDKVRYPFKSQLTDLGAQSLGIYFVNTPAIYVAAVLMYRLTPWILGYQLLYLPILFVFGLGAPLLLMKLAVQTPARRVYSYVFG